MIQLIVSGLAAGSSYALMALALVLVLKATDVPNFAQAEIGLVGAFVLWTLMSQAGVPYWAALPVALLGAAALAIALERVLIRPILAESHFATVLMTIGLFVALNSVTSLIWGSQPRRIDSPFGGSFRIAGNTVTVEQIVAIAAGALITFGLTRFFRTTWGVQMQAVAEDRVTPRLLGVSVNRVFTLSWGLAGAISALALVLLTESTVLSDQSASGLIIKGFVAATIGGFSSVTGAFVGGLALGVLENLAGGFISTASESAVALLVIVLLLMARPEGLFGRNRPREV